MQKSIINRLIKSASTVAFQTHSDNSLKLLD